MPETAKTESPTQIVDRVINEEKRWLESQGLSISTEILFGSVQHGNIKKDGSSDVDVYFVTSDETWPTTIGGQALVPDDRPGHHFSVEATEFPLGTGLSHVKYHVASPERVIDALDKVKSILDETRPLDEMITYKSEGTDRTTTVEAMTREKTWVYQVFKTGQVMAGEISPQILAKVEEIDAIFDQYRDKVVKERLGKSAK